MQHLKLKNDSKALIYVFVARVCACAYMSY